MERMDYVKAAQPRIVALFLVTVLAAMLLAGAPGAAQMVAVLAATGLTVAGATMLNNMLERDPDARMERTRRRPTASGRLRPGRALTAGLAAVAAGVLALWAVAGGLAAVFALLGGWAATGAPWSGDVLFLCVVVFTWSPPHFWALSLAREDDYRSSGIPTPAVRYGERTTRVLIVGFFAALTGIVTAAAVTGLYGIPYLALALAANLVLWFFVTRLLVAQTSAAAWALFKVSGPCLAAIVAAAVVDRLL